MQLDKWTVTVVRGQVMEMSLMGGNRKEADETGRVWEQKENVNFILSDEIMMT